MTVPSLQKTWYFQVNTTITQQGSTLATGRLLMRTVKDTFLGAGSWTDSSNAAATLTNNWVVDFSSDSTAPGTGTAGDGVDHWTVNGSLVWATAGTAHSWMVIKNTQMPGGTLWVCIDLSNANAYNCTIVISRVGFTGGSTTNRPTATDEVVTLNNTTWGMDTGGTTSMKLHALKSSDNQHHRVVISRNGWGHGLWMFEAITTTDNWTKNLLVYTNGTSSANYGGSYLVFTNNFNGSGPLCYSITEQGTPWVGSLAVPFAPGPIFDMISKVTAVAEMNSAWPAMSIGIESHSNYTYTGSTPSVAIEYSMGYAGKLKDLFWVPSSLGEGDQAPSGGGANFSMIGDTCWPWNTTAISLT